MNRDLAQLDRLRQSSKPLLFQFGWPEPVGLTEDAIRAAIYCGIASDQYPTVLLVREDGRFLEVQKFQSAWTLAAGQFDGANSLIDEVVVRANGDGTIATPKGWIPKLLRVKRDREMGWNEALEAAFCFAGYGEMPPMLTWCNHPPDG